eukprot:6178624-Pleurochrysis_carterae.AAC.5
MDCSSSLLPCTNTGPSFRGESSLCLILSSFYVLNASSALLEEQLLRASFLAMLCVFYVSGFRKAELVAYLPERATRLTRASVRCSG